MRQFRMANLTLQQIQTLSVKERKQLGACTNYFLSKEYFIHKRRKRTMRAIQEIENNENRATITSAT